MVLEALVTPQKAERHPLELFFLGMLYSSVAMFVSMQIFDSYAGLIAVFLTVLATLPLFYATVKHEERLSVHSSSERKLLKHHARTLIFLTTLFLGIVFAFSLWYIFLPMPIVQNVFQVQAQTINRINAVSGSFSSDLLIVSRIFFNNVKVLAFCILFSFFYGAGAIFILAWNASVISVAIGNFFRNGFSAYATEIGWTKLGGYFHIYGLSLARYLIHGIPEVLAYFIGGLVGGIISIALIRQDFKGEAFGKILLDLSDLVLVAVGLLLIGVILEVYFTPYFFG
ncbi:MAG TPA: stage II sporulation protein M [Candidatus Nanoarchaeia archaeon]|nr:stage II sporulation protein M [Candidatus Nanoarchaeia archaeon]